MFARDLLSTLSQKLNAMEALLLWGPRQTGKTTLLSHLPQVKSQVYLDDLQLRRLAVEDPALFLEGYEVPMLIDECAYAPELFPEMKLQIDRTRHEKFKKKGKDVVTTNYYLTGSNKSLLDRSVKESLAGI